MKFDFQELNKSVRNLKSFISPPLKLYTSTYKVDLYLYEMHKASYNKLS